MQPTPQWPRQRAIRAAAGIVAAAAAIAAVPAAAAVWNATADPFLTSAELLVTSGFSALAVLPQAALPVRVAAAATAALWVIGTVAPGAATAHQAGLAWLLVAAAGGWHGVRGAFGLAVVAVALASGLLPTLASTALFAGLSAWAGVRAARGRARRPAFAAAVGAGLVALGLLSAWVAQAWTIGLAPRTALLFYCGTLVSVALIVGAGAIAERRRAARLRDAAAAAGDATGLAGLELVLQSTLRDDALRLAVPSQDERPATGTEPDVVTTDVIDGAGSPVARIHHRPDSLAEPAVARALADAVRLSVEHDRLQQRLEAQRREIARTRADLSDAAQAGRLAVARRVDDDVLAPLRDGSLLLERLRSDAGPGAGSAGTTPEQDALEIARSELSRAEEDLNRVIAAAGTRDLGDGRLASELRALARSGVPAVGVEADAQATGDATTENALYYIASEALANAMKYADASRIDLRLTRAGDDMLRLEVEDDGRGGAESAAAIRRRVDALAGELSVESPPGRGTRVTVAVPRRRSASTAR